MADALRRLFNHTNAPPNSLIDSTMSLNVKIGEGQRFGVRSFVCNTSGVEGCVGAPKWGLG
jgi:hypothetical protein